MLKLALAATALALAGCGTVESNEQIAARACYGVEPWQAHHACVRSEIHHQEDLDQGNQAMAAGMLTGFKYHP